MIGTVEVSSTMGLGIAIRAVYVPELNPWSEVSGVIYTGRMAIATVLRRITVKRRRPSGHHHQPWDVPAYAAPRTAAMTAISSRPSGPEMVSGCMRGRARFVARRSLASD